MLLGPSVPRAVTRRDPSMSSRADDGGRHASVLPRIRLPGPVNAFVRRAEQRLGTPPRVLVYHRIGEQSTTSLDLSVSPRHFEEQVSVLAQRASVVPLDELSASGRVIRTSSTKPRFSITFDDGYADSLITATPVLERYNVPAAVFVASDFIDRPFFWWDRLTEIALDADTPADAIVDAGEDDGLLAAPQAAGLRRKSKSEVHRELIRVLAMRENPARYDFLDRLECSGDFSPRADSPRPLSSLELSELAAHPLITIGNHTLTHRRLTSLPPAEALFEIIGCDRRLNELIGSGSACRPLAYPHGDADQATVKIAARAGCRTAFSTESRPISLTDSPLLLPRIATSDVNGDDFARLRRLS